MNYNFSNSAQFLNPVKNHLRDNATIIREKFKDGDLMTCWYQPVSAFYFMIDFTQTPVFKKYQKDKSDKTDYAMKICEDMLNTLGVVIVPGTDFGLSNSARISLVLHKEVFSDAIGKIVRFLNNH